MHLGNPISLIVLPINSVKAVKDIHCKTELNSDAKNVTNVVKTNKKQSHHSVDPEKWSNKCNCAGFIGNKYVIEPYLGCYKLMYLSFLVVFLQHDSFESLA